MQTAELFEVRLRLRPDVRCALQTSAGTPYYQLEDPLTGRFYRMGCREWAVVRLLDGTRTLGQVLAAPRPATDPPGVTAEQAVSTARWLLQNQLATVVGNRRHPLFAPTSSARSKLPGWLNPVFLRVPLFNPDRLLAWCLPWFGWTLTPLATVGWLATCLAAGYQVAVHWEEFTAPIANILAPDNWLYLLFVWIALKAVHEFYHGLICRKFGGEVPSCGLVFILFSPVAFVDVTSSWRFRSKWRRIYTAAGGMYAELFVAALAVQAWVRSDPGIWNQLCHNLVTMASVSTLLFNSNFLMRFDGYYIVSDCLEMQNLYGSGQQYVRYLTRRYLLGLPPREAAFKWFVRVYGVASLVWRIVFYCGIVLTAATMFRGAGIVISLGVGLLWILLPACRFGLYLYRGHGPEQPNRRHFAVVAGGIAAVIGGLVLLPWPGGIVATGVVDYEPLAVLRASSPGFLREISVRPGADVVPGQPLARIENRNLELELAAAQFAVKKSETLMQMYQGAARYAEYKVEAKHCDSLRRRQAELAAQCHALDLVAPCEGRVLSRELTHELDQYQHAGEAVLAIGREEHKAIRVAVSQQNVDFFLRQVGRQPRIRIKGRGRPVSGAQLAKINPRATKRLPHPALAAQNGGPLAVVAASSAPSGADDAFELVEPHFQATVALPAEAARSLRAGELARVRLGAAGESIGGHLWKTAQRWIRRKLRTS